MAAVQAIMGHAPSSNDMNAVYRERVDDDRLRAVVDHVRTWLYGTEQEGQTAGNRQPLLDRQTEDGLRPIQPSGAEHRLVVSGPPALVAQGATAEAEQEVTRSLRVLWRDGELGGAVEFPLGSRASMAEVA